MWSRYSAYLATAKAELHWWPRRTYAYGILLPVLPSQRKPNRNDGHYEAAGPDSRCKNAFTIAAAVLPG